MSNRSFVRVFLLSAGIMFLGIAALNYSVNPYAQYPCEFLVPLVQTSRAQKVEMLQSHADAPDGLIVGSSRVLKYEPEYLRQRTGQSFFNAGVNYGKPEDHLAFVRLYRREFGRAPKTLIIGLDVHGFNERLPTDARLLNLSALADQIPDAIPWLDRFQGAKELLSWQQTVASVNSIRHTIRGRRLESPAESFREDGVIVYHDRERQISAGNYDFGAALAYNRREYKQLFAGYDRLCLERFRLLLKTIELCRTNGGNVYVFLSPMHPQLTKYLTGSTTYTERHSELVDLLRDASRSHDFRFVDLSDIDSFNGLHDQFVDGIHPLESNTRRAIDRLLNSPPSGAQYALQ